jgi:hypothetical protein
VPQMCRKQLGYKLGKHGTKNVAQFYSDYVMLQTEFPGIIMMCRHFSSFISVH